MHVYHPRAPRWLKNKQYSPTQQEVVLLVVCLGAWKSDAWNVFLLMTPGVFGKKIDSVIWCDSYFLRLMQKFCNCFTFFVKNIWIIRTQKERGDDKVWKYVYYRYSGVRTQYRPLVARKRNPSWWVVQVFWFLGKYLHLSVHSALYVKWTH